MQFFKQNFGASALLLICLTVGALLGGCGDSEGDGSIVTGTSGRLLVQPLNVSFSQANLGETQTQDVTLTNIHPTESLTLYDITLSPREGGSAADLKLLDKPAGETRLAAGETRTFQVEFHSQGIANRAKIEVISSDPNYGRATPFKVDVDTQANRPVISFSPSAIRFPPVGRAAEQPLIVRNYGSAPLIIYDVGYSGNS